ncbi:methyltransferase [Candidatus Methylacidiphilum fumarolicum]|uniref:Rsm22 family methyltransferase n=2 Tax=Candidatus Methylacidiphilum fumarolicum TaxID=591154 RepID=I0K0Y2_METFB|nr:small ribosomal subunit Rsm22 family protein [Candidatus Methylacidiphilum fumarolicum]MBW6413978.1 small ribosomal subunit Rsm22 family protein [Candidatus Methylacidiphilum fumarolicum]TFE70521.1 methyltransferase [Candidatus Methylacidiphilum fumarolicum]TFE74761.1 methyltransferase [Candidatus Methylacidiphilum fumarolicum]TFE76007.1 methyltransferase [Candidatus Methylacidiphilum fumarolicum]TFE76408.1 methyltransferase [Candidatus Methylacidiphilum fumarolicum]
MERELTKREEEILEKLRAIFLSGGKQLQPYWKSEEELILYDKVFGERIRWKWQSVLNELSLLGWIPPQSHLVDWGCGTGIAARSFCSWAIANNFKVLSSYFWDYSPLAIKYAQSVFSKEFPNIHRKELKKSQLPEQFILLLSHVLGELTEEAFEEILSLAKNALAILWVEPAKKDYSQKLIHFREILRKKFWVIAPCLHQQRCQLLEQEKNWCHFFASVPREIFQSSFWSYTQNLLGIDLHSLAYSYLVLESNTNTTTNNSQKEHNNLFRIIGTVRAYKGYSILDCCYDSGELKTKRYLHRYNPWLSKRMKKGVEASTLAKDIAENPSRSILLGRDHRVSN